MRQGIAIPWRRPDFLAQALGLDVPEYLDTLNAQKEQRDRQDAHMSSVHGLDLSNRWRRGWAKKIKKKDIKCPICLRAREARDTESTASNVALGKPMWHIPRADLSTASSTCRLNQADQIHSHLVTIKLPQARAEDCVRERADVVESNKLRTKIIETSRITQYVHNYTRRVRDDLDHGTRHRNHRNLARSRSAAGEHNIVDTPRAVSAETSTRPRQRQRTSVSCPHGERRSAAALLLCSVRRSAAAVRHSQHTAWLLFPLSWLLLLLAVEARLI